MFLIHSSHGIATTETHENAIRMRAILGGHITEEHTETRASLCPSCGHTAPVFETYMGALRGFEHHRCTACGLDFHTERGTL